MPDEVFSSLTVLYIKELAEDLKSELGGDLEETVTGLLMPPVEYDAFCLHSSPGASDSVMLGILCTASPKVTRVQTINSMLGLNCNFSGNISDLAHKISSIGNPLGKFDLLFLEKGEEGVIVTSKMSTQMFRTLSCSKNSCKCIQYSGVCLLNCPPFSR